MIWGGAQAEKKFTALPTGKKNQLLNFELISKTKRKTPHEFFARGPSGLLMVIPRYR